MNARREVRERRARPAQVATPARALLVVVGLLLAGCGGAPRRAQFVTSAPVARAADDPRAIVPRTDGGDVTAADGGAITAAGSARAPFPAPAAQGRKAEIGAPAPGFELVDLGGRTVRLSDYKGKTVVLEWLNPACPYSAFAWSAEGPLRELTERLLSQGTVWLAINSETPEQAGGEVQRNQRFARENKLRVPVLLDPVGKVGRLYEAKTTPHVFVISPRGVLVYRGALDNAPLGKVRDDAAKTSFVEAALADLRSGRGVTAAETKPYGSPVRFAK